MNLSRPSSITSRGCIIALIAITLLAHGRDLFHDFVEWDDQELVAQHDLLNPVTPAGLRRMWTEPVQGLYSPLSYTAWAALTAVARVDTPDSHGATLSPGPFHGFNLLLHVVSVLVVFDILRNLLPLPGGERAGVRGGTSTDERHVSLSDLSQTTPTDDSRLPPHLTSPLRGEGPMLPAMIGAALFAVHPLQVEPVAWVSGMNNLLAGLFSLVAISAYVRHAKSTRGGWYAIVIVALLLAYLSKPTALATPLVLLAIDVFILRRSLKKMAIALPPMVLLATPFVFMGRTAQTDTHLFVPSITQRFAVAGDAIGFYVQKLLWPWPLLMDYSRTPQSVLASGGSALTWLAFGVLVIAFAISAWRWRAIAGCIVIFVAGIALVLGFVPFYFQETSTVADRYVYLSMLGPALLLAMLLARWHRPAVTTMGALLVLIFAGLSVVQSGFWRDTITLCSHTIDNNPRTLAARAAIGAAFRNASNFSAAEKQYQAALAINPDAAIINYNYGNLMRDAQPAAAVELYRAARAAGYENPRLLLNLGTALFKTGRVDEAVDVFREVIKMVPGDPSGYINLGNSLGARAEFDEAEKQFRKALEIDPNSALAARGLQKIASVRSAKP